MGLIIPKNRLSHIEWHLDNYYIKGAPFSFAEYPFLFDIYMDESHEICVQKAAQVGISEFLISRSIYVCAYLSGTTIYLFPTSQHIGDFVQHRVDPTIQDSPNLRKLVSTSQGQIYKKSANKVKLKQIDKGFLYLRGTKSLMEVTSVPGDFLPIDEYDQCTQKHIPPAEKRISNSDLKWIAKVSTPELPEGPIETEYKMSDARKWFIKCDFCNTRQPLIWDINIVREHKGLNEINSSFLPYLPRDPRITEDVAEALGSDDWRSVIEGMNDDISAICSNCGKYINRLAVGEWVPEFTSRSSHGYHVHKMISPRVKLAELYSEFIRGRSDVDKTSIFYRQSLGLGYDPSGQSLTETILRFLQQNINVDALKYDFISMGGDVGSFFHIQISKNIGNLRIPWLKFAVKTKEEVKDLLKLYNVNICVLDVEPETRIVEEIRDFSPSTVYLCKFGKRAEAKETTDTDWFDPDFSINRIMADRTMCFDQATHDIMNKICVVNTSWVNDAVWVAHMTNPKRIEKQMLNGNKRNVWERTSADHYRLADVYDMMASKLYKMMHEGAGGRDVIVQEIEERYYHPELVSVEDDFDTQDVEENNKILKRLGAFDASKYPKEYLEIIKNG